MPHRPLAQAGIPAAFGLYGKLPVRGDFLRAGLPRATTDAWYAWVQSVLPSDVGSLTGTAQWLGGPAWRFALAPGRCGPAPLLGLWLPSVDSVGRLFPLLLAATSTQWDCAVLDRVEDLGRDAVAGRLEPGALATALRGLTPGPVHEAAAAERRLPDHLPGAASLAEMLPP